MKETTMLQVEDAILSHRCYLQFFSSFLRSRFQGKEEIAEYLDFEKDVGELEALLALHFPGRSLERTDLLLLTLTLLPHLDPVALDRIFGELLGEGDFPQLGGVRGQQHRGILPTGETALFLLAGDDPDQRTAVLQNYLSPRHWLFQEQVLFLEPPAPGEPRLSGRLVLNPEYVELLTMGEVSPPAFSMAFPAQRITTRMDWEDLVLNPC